MEYVSSIWGTSQSSIWGTSHNADLNKGSIWDIDEPFCVHAKETLQWLIWDLYEKTK